MMDKSPSDDYTLEELRSEFDWMFKFISRMAEYVRNDPDVHSFAGYVGKLESENKKLRKLVKDMWTSCHVKDEDCAACKYRDDEWPLECALFNRTLELGVKVVE